MEYLDWSSHNRTQNVVEMRRAVPDAVKLTVPSLETGCDVVSLETGS